MTIIALTLLAIVLAPVAAVLLVIDFFRWSGRGRMGELPAPAPVTWHRSLGQRGQGT